NVEQRSPEQDHLRTTLQDVGDGREPRAVERHLRRPCAKCEETPDNESDVDGDFETSRCRRDAVQFVQLRDSPIELDRIAGFVAPVASCAIVRSACSNCSTDERSMRRSSADVAYGVALF